MNDKEMLQELLEQRNNLVSLMFGLERGWWPFVSRKRMVKEIFQILVSTEGFRKSYQRNKEKERSRFEEEIKKCIQQMQ